MWKTTLAMVLVGLTWFADVRSDLLEQVRSAQTSAEAKDAATRLAEALPDGEERLTYLQSLSEILAHRGQLDVAEDVLAASRGRVGESLEPYLRLRLSAIQLRGGRLTAAQATAEEGLGLAASVPREELRRGLESDFHGRLGEIHEAGGRYVEAVDHYERWEWTSFCGVGAFGFLHRRSLALARCRFELGETETALDALIVLVGDGRGGISFEQGEAAVRFAEFSARAGRDDAEKRLLSRVSKDRHGDARGLARIGAALASLDVAAVLDACRGGVDDPSLPVASAHLRTVVPHVAAAELKRLGAAIEQPVSEAIVAGNRVATLMAMQSGLPGAVRGVRARRQTEQDETWRRVMIDWLVSQDESK